VVALADASLVTLGSRAYTPYGEPIPLAGTLDTPYAFTGEPRDASGLQYHRARYYDPSAGVWTALDPFEGLVGRPQSLNGYGCVEGNPANDVDPTGFGGEKHLPAVLNSSCNGGLWHRFRNLVETWGGSGRSPCQSLKYDRRRGFTAPPNIYEFYGCPIPVKRPQPNSYCDRVLRERNGVLPLWHYGNAGGAGCQYTNSYCRDLVRDNPDIDAQSLMDTGVCSNLFLDCDANRQALFAWANPLSTDQNLIRRVKSTGIILGGSGGYPLATRKKAQFGFGGEASFLIMYETSGRVGNAGTGRCTTYLTVEGNIAAGGDLGIGIYGALTWSTATHDQAGGWQNTLTIDTPISTGESFNVNFGISQAYNSTCDRTAVAGLGTLGLPTIAFSFGKAMRLPIPCGEVAEAYNTSEAIIIADMQFLMWGSAVL